MKKVLSILLALLMVSFVFVACGSDASTDTKDTTAAPVVTTAPTVDETTLAPETEEGPGIEAVDYSGKTIRILANEPRDTDFNYSEVAYTEEMGDVINDAIFKRNAQIVDKYKVELETIHGANGIAGYNEFVKAINAGNDDYHAATIRIRDIMQAAANKLLVNLEDAAPINPDAPWYYKNLQDALSIGNRDYMLTGYLNMRIFDSAGALYYNKNVVDKFELGDINQLVFDGKWTVDTFFELCAKVGNDLNNDGKIDETDEVGLTAHPGGILNFFVGAGCDFVRKDADDIPYYVGMDETNEARLSKILNLLYTEPGSLHKEYAQFNGNFTTAFNDNRSLFLNNCLYEMRLIAEKGTDFGVLPLPKYDETQEEYRIHTHSGLGTALGIPFNNSELEMTANIIEDMMYLSYKYIYPAHIEKTMQLRYATDEASTNILKIMFNSLCIEMSTALQLTCDNHLRTLGNYHSTLLASTFKATEKANNTSIEKYVAGFTE